MRLRGCVCPKPDSSKRAPNQDVIPSSSASQAVTSRRNAVSLLSPPNISRFLRKVRPIEAEMSPKHHSNCPLRHPKTTNGISRDKAHRERGELLEMN